MAVLTSPGITFSDLTTASSRSSFGFPANTISVFYKQSAPTGWTAVAQNDKMLRVVSGSSGTGGTAGGTNAFSATLTNRSVSQTVTVSITASASPVTLDTNMIPSHSHPANNGANTSASPGSNVSVVNPGSGTGGVNATPSGGSAHTHPVSATASGPWSASIDMRVQYCDVILCTWGG